MRLFIRVLAIIISKIEVVRVTKKLLTKIK
jgi:hypothetical protein